ncbi:hypothetical protein LSUB1_G004333 [Lachnellula subtilissima]|uniref:Apple domain-containing protein n=1 Tax=Lachnellula subtilissima TaxID=602034 RepID=A0A8H8U9X8_9HELO|nr:hypothetical protein LSUB1_G004333 [Lachnellula subtilissima]
MTAPSSDPEMAHSSDLQVVPGFGLEHHYHVGLEVDTTKHNPTESHSNSEKQAYNSAIPYNRRLCGLAPRNFWIIAVVGTIVMIGAAVGGGVGGSLASKSNSTAESPATVAESSVQPLTTSTASIVQSTDSTTPSLTSTVALTTTQITGPSYTLLRDCPSSNNTLYGISLGSTNMNFRKVCGKTYLNTLSSSQNAVNQKSSSLDNCINLCATYNVQNASAIASGQNNVCNAVCWRNSLANDDFPGQCFGFTTQNSSSAFVVSDEAKCDSAAWVDQQLI